MAPFMGLQPTKGSLGRCRRRYHRLAEGSLVLAASLLALSYGSIGGAGIVWSDPPEKNAVDAARAGTIVSSDGGTMTHPDLKEISGIDSGIRNPNVYWAHNDSGDTNRIFAIDAKTGQTLGTYTLSGANATDWEDIEVATGSDGRSYIYVGDIGDNLRRRSDIVVYRVLEPTVTGTASNPTNITLTGVDQLPLHYPNGEKHNAEALAVNPRSSNLMLIEKTDGDISRVYTAPENAWGRSGHATLQQVAALNLSEAESKLVTSANFSQDGSQFALRTYHDVWLWNRAPNSTPWSPLSQPPVRGPKVRGESQGEAIAFHPDGKGYVTVSEGANQTLHHFRTAVVS